MKALLCVALAACGTPPDRKLPGASPTPPLAARPDSIACGQDIAPALGAPPTARYRFAYDDRARLVMATGTFAAGGPDDIVAYSYDNLGHMTHMIGTRTGNEVIADYDTLGDLVNYVETGHHYALSDFTDSGQPRAETIDGLAYALDYDETGRLARVATAGSLTLYTYDDDARTVTVDTDSGRFRGVIVYGDANRELSETWGGSDPRATASDTEYTWSGDRMLSATYRQGTPLAVVEVDTFRYDCIAAR